MVRSRPAAPRLAGLVALVLVLTACAGTQPRDPHTYEVLAEASLPRGGLTWAMLKVMGEVAREGAVALVLEEVGRDHGYDDTWRPGNRYYDRAAELVERSMEPMLSRMDPTPLLERNLRHSLERNLTQSEAQELVAKLATPEGQRFTEYLDASIAEGMLSGIAGRTPAPFRKFMVERLELSAPAARSGARAGHPQRGGDRSDRRVQPYTGRPQTWARLSRLGGLPARRVDRAAAAPHAAGEGELPALGGRPARDPAGV